MSAKIPIEVKRQAAAMAGALGLQEAARKLGMSQSRLCEWRLEVERETGERFERKHHWRARRPKKLSATKEAALRQRRARNVSWGVLARIYGVSVATCRRAAGAMR